ncbi:MAG: hypothetical protein QGF98_03605 [Candidatus Poseidoniia archaeon]|jgi:hypothetical protein|nr:hypothetical protein [Candidatus Poseidoniia archaeon]
MRFGPLMAVVFAFFLIAIYPYYAEDDESPIFIVSDDDGDGVTNDKDKCPEEDASERDIDEDGCIDSEITKEEVDYIEKIAKFNLGQYILFAVLSLLGTAIYWEREKLKAALYEDDDLDFSKLTEQEKSGDIEEDIDYAELGKDKKYNIQTESSGSFSFSFSKLSEEADLGAQIICVAYIVLLFAALGYVGEFSWFNVEGTQNGIDFEARHYSEHMEYGQREDKIADWEEFSGEIISYESSHCTDEVDKFYNCDYRQSLFGTVNSLLSISLFLGFFAILLAFRAQKYRIWLASVFSIALITSMASLLIFTSLIDNALIADSHTLDENQEMAGGCWMSNPAIWGKTECVSLEGEGEYSYETEISYSPGISFYIVLICISMMFVGLFTHIVPMITMEQITWTEAVKRNWQVFAVIFLIVFLGRLNVLMTNL